MHILSVFLFLQSIVFANVEFPADRTIVIRGVQKTDQTFIGNPRYWFTREDGRTVKITCSVDVFMDPKMYVALQNEQNSHATGVDGAQMNMRSIAECKIRLDRVYDWASRGLAISIRVSKPIDGYYTRVDFIVNREFEY